MTKREIKFRAWDEENQFMAYSDNRPCYGRDNYEWEVSSCAGVRCYEYEWTDDDYGGNVKYSEALPIMQYIGIKDLNKDEIYEGDILYDDLSNSYVTVFYDENIAAFAIVDHPDFPMEELVEWEIVSNIYEQGEKKKWK